ncbi:hypothetical protein JCM3766R1_002813 [Sporobolomyces carnicolor]
MSVDSEWTSLLAWLAKFDTSANVEQHVQLVHNAAGRGLVARHDLSPSTLLISIPNQALLNLYTLHPLYPPAFTDGRLNATQLISLHLAISFRQHLRSAPSSTPPSTASRDKYWPFLATLPRSFPSHPLTWQIKSQSNAQLTDTYSLDEGDNPSLSPTDRDEPGPRERARYRKLLDSLGTGVRARVDEVEGRFRKDWQRVRDFWRETKLEDEDEFGFFDFLLGWLNVNTRCIYFDLPSTSDSPSHWSKKENSLTLAPVIDMINHAPSLATKPHPTPSALTFSAPSRSSPDRKVSKGDELAFSYGGHDDAFLLSEYGFIIGNADADGSGGNEYNSLSIDKYIDALFDSQGAEGETKIEILKETDYWGDMTLQSHPPSPSWRVLTALRLYHLRLPSNSSLSADSLAPFYDLLAGSIEQISHLNEKKVQATVKAIAKSLVVECQEGVARCTALEAEWSKESGKGEKALVDETLQWLGMVKQIWEGDERIAKAVAEGS